MAPFADLSEHLAEAFAVHPSRHLDAEAHARRAYLARHRDAQETYRWKHPGAHAEACRRWYGSQPHVMARRVWREIEAAAREAEERRRAIRAVLAEIRG